MELIDVVDENDQVKDQKPRSECHGENPEKHRAVSVLTFRTPEREEILLQRRSEEKDRKAGRLEVTGGHLQTGENYGEAAIREYAEELYSAPKDTAPVEHEDLERMFKLYKESHDNREFVEVYETVNPGPFDPYKREVADVFFEDVDKVAEMLENNPKKFTHATREAVNEYLERENYAMKTVKVQ